MAGGWAKRGEVITLAPCHLRPASAIIHPQSARTWRGPVSGGPHPSPLPRLGLCHLLGGAAVDGPELGLVRLDLGLAHRLDGLHVLALLHAPQTDTMRPDRNNSHSVSSVPVPGS